MSEQTDRGRDWVITKARNIAAELGLAIDFEWARIPHEHKLMLVKNRIPTGDCVGFSRPQIEDCCDVNPRIQDRLGQIVRRWLKRFSKRKP